MVLEKKIDALADGRSHKVPNVHAFASSRCCEVFGEDIARNESPACKHQHGASFQSSEMQEASGLRMRPVQHFPDFIIWPGCYAIYERGVDGHDRCNWIAAGALPTNHMEGLFSCFAGGSATEAGHLREQGKAALCVLHTAFDVISCYSSSHTSCVIPDSKALT